MRRERNGHMNAAVLYGREDVKIERVDIPRVADDEVLVRVEVALTCGTDLKVWKQGFHARMIKPPALFGHELAGVIEEQGRSVNGGVHKGMRVLPANSAPCNTCFFCRKGQPNLCEDLLFNNGAYAEYIRIPGRIVRQNMLEIPEGVSFVDAAMAEPLACVLRGIHETGIRPADTVVVIGCGPIGLKFIRVLSTRGVRVIALGKRKTQTRAAERLGAVAAFDISEIENPVRLVRELSEGGRGADAVIEAVGTADHLAVGRADGAQRRHRKSFWRLPARRARGVRSCGSALFRDHHQVDVPSHAAIHARSAGDNCARRSSRQRFHHRGSAARGVAGRVRAHETPQRPVEDCYHSLSLKRFCRATAARIFIRKRSGWFETGNRASSF